MIFKLEHLEYAKQTYFEHFKDALFYSILSTKAAAYFLIHSIFPNFFVLTSFKT